MTPPHTTADNLTAADMMSDDVVVVSETASCRDLMDVLISNHISGVPVVNKENQLSGTICLRDVVRYKNEIPYLPSIADVQEGFVGHYMSKNLVTVKSETPVAEVAKTMRENHIHRVIVCDDGHTPLGMISTYDFLTYFES